MVKFTGEVDVALPWGWNVAKVGGNRSGEVDWRDSNHKSSDRVKIKDNACCPVSLFH